jgi:hypothetical protein
MLLLDTFALQVRYVVDEAEMVIPEDEVNRMLLDMQSHQKRIIS